MKRLQDKPRISANFTTINETLLILTSFCGVSCKRSIASFKECSPQSAIECFVSQVTVPPLFFNTLQRTGDADLRF